MSSDVNKVGVKLSWDVVFAKFDNLIKFAAKQQVQKQTPDTMISAEDLYQEGLIKLYDCWMKWCVDPKQNKDMDEFKAIFKVSLFRAVKNIGDKGFDCIDLEDAVIDNMMAYSSTEETVDQMYIRHGIEHLYETLNNPIAKDILREMEDPSIRTIFEAWADVKRKEMIKSQGKRVNIPKDNSIKMKHIVKSLGISQKQYDTAMLEIKEKARLVIDLY